jgi:FecR protein
MTTLSGKVTIIGTLWVVIQALTQPALAQESAATIEFVFGTAEIISVAGDKRAVEKGSSVFVGDTVVTMDARTQLRFTDGSFVSLLPGSEFRVNAYTFNGTLDGNERLSMELLKGGLRTISGLVGKKIQSAYELITRVSTIGIRGTEYSVVYGETLSGSVAHGRIAVCNGAGCLDVAQGQSYFVRDENTRPVLTNKAAQLPPPAPSDTKRKIAERAKTNSTDKDTQVAKKDDSSERADDGTRQDKTPSEDRLDDKKNVETSDSASRGRDSPRDQRTTSSAQAPEDLESSKRLSRGDNVIRDDVDARKDPESSRGKPAKTGGKSRNVAIESFNLSGPTVQAMGNRPESSRSESASSGGKSKNAAMQSFDLSGPTVLAIDQKPETIRSEPVSSAGKSQNVAMESFNLSGPTAQVMDQKPDAIRSEPVSSGGNSQNVSMQSFNLSGPSVLAMDQKPDAIRSEPVSSGGNSQNVSMESFKLSGPTVQTLEQRIDPATQSEITQRNGRNLSGRLGKRR